MAHRKHSRFHKSIINQLNIHWTSKVVCFQKKRKRVKNKDINYPIKSKIILISLYVQICYSLKLLYMCEGFVKLLSVN